MEDNPADDIWDFLDTDPQFASQASHAHHPTHADAHLDGFHGSRSPAVALTPQEEAELLQLQQDLDREIQHKRQELEQLNSALVKTNKTWQQLQQICSKKQFIEESIQNYQPEPAREQPSKKRKRSEITGGPKSKGLFVHLADGTFGKVTCPTCKKSAFNALPGFVTHCKHSHNVDLTPVMAMAHCVVPVDDSSVPPDDPARLEPAGTHPLHRSKQGEFTAPAIPDLPEEQVVDASRMLVHKKVLVGNSDKYVQKIEESEEHSWVVYVRGPSNEDISKFVKKARFFLHPFYAPNNIVEVAEPPFQISRVGWFEFPVRVQLFFHDARNKPCNIIYRLKLATTIGGMVVGNEKEHEIELDKRYLMFAPPTIPAPVFPPSEDESDDSEEAGLSDEEDEDDDDTPLKPIETHEDLLEVIQAAIDIFPVVSPDPNQGDDDIYSAARSLDQWYSWPLGKRKYLLQFQASMISGVLMDTYKLLKSTSEVVELCKPFNPPIFPDGTQPTYQALYGLPAASTNGRPPAVKNRFATKKLHLCRFCGNLHLPPNQSVDSQIECGLTKLRRQHISSLSTFGEFHGRALAIPPPIKPSVEQSGDGVSVKLEAPALTLPPPTDGLYLPSAPLSVATPATTSTATLTLPRAAMTKTKGLFKNSLRRIAAPNPSPKPNGQGMLAGFNLTALASPSRALTSLADRPTIELPDDDHEMLVDTPLSQLKANPRVAPSTSSTDHASPKKSGGELSKASPESSRAVLATTTSDTRKTPNKPSVTVEAKGLWPTGSVSIVSPPGSAAPSLNFDSKASPRPTPVKLASALSAVATTTTTTTSSSPSAAILSPRQVGASTNPSSVAASPVSTPLARNPPLHASTPSRQSLTLPATPAVLRLAPAQPSGAMRPVVVATVIKTEKAPTAPDIRFSAKALPEPQPLDDTTSRAMDIVCNDIGVLVEEDRSHLAQSVLYIALAGFVRRVVDETLVAHADDRLRETSVDNGNTKAVSVLHVFEGLLRRPELDFLTNMGLLDAQAPKPSFGSHLPEPQPELLKPFDLATCKRKKKKPKLEAKDEELAVPVVDG